MGEMPRKIPSLAWLAIPLAYLLYFYRLTAIGLVGPDEPRYASIGRQMAISGDWITPRLWGHPWFEKPALLYWLTGLGNRLGLGPELAPRLPVALISVGFLIFFWWIARREFGCRTAWFATLILGTSAEWFGYSQVSVPDLPMTAAFSAAMLLALPWITRRDGRFLPAASALFGFAVLAKGLTPLALGAPVLPLAWWIGRQREAREKAPVRPAWREITGDLLRLRVIAPFLIVALPWYVLCYVRNGMPFLEDFFWKQHFLRVTTTVLKHQQPWWFYLPVFAGALAPWTPLLVLVFRRAPLRDSKRLVLLAWVVWGLFFFSLAINKLPGYILPLLPTAALLAAAALEETRRAGPWLVACALLLALFPVVGPMLPAAVAFGSSHAPHPQFHWAWLSPLAAAAAVWALEARGRRLAAVAMIAAGVTAGIVYVKVAIAPEADRIASARSLWRQIEGRSGDVCVERLERDPQYGLNYYAGAPLPACSAAPSRPIQVRQQPDEPPSLVPAPAYNPARR